MHRIILEMSTWALQACCSWATLSWQLSSLAQLLLRPAMVHDLPVIQHKTLGASIRGIISFVNRNHLKPLQTSLAAGMHQHVNSIYIPTLRGEVLL